MSNCLCDVVRLLSCCVTCHPNPGSVPGSAIRKYLHIRKYSGKCNLQHVPDLQLPVGSGTLPPGTRIPKLPQGTGLREVHLFQTKMDQKDPPNLVFCSRQHILRCWGRVGYSLRKGGGSRYPLPGDTTQSTKFGRFWHT